MAWLATRGARRDVIFVGAGFSIAASRSFPDTNSLGRQVAELDPKRLDGSADGLSFGPKLGFEAWLTRLAERQPYDDDESQFRRAALFARVQRLIASALLQSTETAESLGLPAWLYELADVLHLNRSTVVTLNYDPLLELAISGARLYSRDGSTRVDPSRAIKYVQIPPGTWSALSARATNTLSLYKLHGSLDWYWVPGDITGNSIVRVERGSQAEKSHVAGRSRFIVPPTSAKSSYFDNATSRYMWSQARAALAECDRVIFLGYSLPLADNAIASLIAEALNRKAIVEIADLHPGRVAANLVALGVDGERVVLHSGKRAISRTVAKLLIETQRRVIDELRSHLSAASDLPVALYWDVSFAAAATKIVRSKNVLVVQFEAVLPFHVANRSRSGDRTDRAPLRCTDLREALDGVDRITLRSTDGRHWPLIDFGVIENGDWTSGHSRSWLALKGAGVVADNVPDLSGPLDLSRQPRIFSQIEEPADPRPGDIWLHPRGSQAEVPEGGVVLP